jgi:MFS transporter, DHA1 family, tetracycline resistance protein
LSAYGYSVPAFAAAGMAFINTMLILFILPESLSGEKREELKKSPNTALTVRLFFETLRRPRVGPILQVRLFFSLSFAMFQSMFALFTQYRLGFDARDTGFSLAYVGVLVAIVQGVLIGVLAKRYKEEKLVLFAAVMFFSSSSSGSGS